MSPRRRDLGYLDERRGLWCLDVDLGRDTTTGKRKRKRLYARDRADLEPKLRALLNRIDEGLPVADERMTVARWCDEYVTSILPYGRAARSAGEHEQILRRYVYPYPIARRPLAKLTPSDVRRWIRELEQRDARPKRDGLVVKLSPDTVAKARAVLSAALTAAVRDEVVTRNVVKLTSPPLGAGKRRIGDAMTVDEVEAVLATAARGRPTYRPGTAELSGDYRPDRLEALAVLVLALGLRQHEALDLAWSDVDLEAGILEIRKAKTPAGERVLPLPALVVDKLREHRAARRAEQLAAEVWNDEGLVFPSSTGSRIGSRNCLRWWHDLTERAGVGRRRFHASRHTAATVLLNRGVPLEQVSAILGHASLAITHDIYARPDVELLRGAVSVVDATYRR